jgi:hypothetical protein
VGNGAPGIPVPSANGNWKGNGKFDQRFLTLHPRTALWWQQREQCRRCEHHLETQFAGKAGGQESCAVSVDGSRLLPCIDAREEGGVCGPRARFFKEAK